MKKQIAETESITRRSMSLISIIVILLVTILDQLSKYFISHSLYLGDGYRVFSWLNLSFQENRGAAFSFLNHSNGWQVYLLVMIAVIVCVGMVFWLLLQPQKSKWQVLAIALIVGGAIGNLIDRLRFGYVIDFIDFHLGNWHYATFNIADSAITIGVGLLIIILLLSKRKQDN